MKIDDVIKVLEQIKQEHGNIPVYLRSAGGQGSAWEIFELEENKIKVEQDVDDWDKVIELCVVIN